MSATAQAQPAPGMAPRLGNGLRQGLLVAVLALALWATLAGALHLVEGTAYLQPLNQSFSLLLWATVLVLAWRAWGRGNRGGLCLALAISLGLIAHLLVWLGLTTREAMVMDFASLGQVLWPMAAGAAACLAAWWLLRRLGLRPDPVVLLGPFVLFSLGLAMLQRIGVEYTGMGDPEVLAALAQRHVQWFALGLGGAVAAALWASPRRLARLGRKKYLLPLAASGLLLLTWAVGPEINGRRLWIDLGLFRLQTVEVCKVMMVLFVASYLADQRLLMSPAGLAGDWRRALEFVGPFALMIGLTLLALVVQKDFGPAALLSFFFVVMLYLAAGMWRAPAGLLIILGGVAVAGYHLRIPSILYIRVHAWLDPYLSSEQLTRGLWSIAAGGQWGAGWGLGSPHTVPLSYSDFAFAALCEELGFVGATAILALFGVLAWRGLVIARRAKDPRGRYLAMGIVTILVLQTLLVVGGVTGLLPLVGLTLPFISHGGTSLVINMTMMGLLLRVGSDSHA